MAYIPIVVKKTLRFGRLCIVIGGEGQAGLMANIFIFPTDSSAVGSYPGSAAQEGYGLDGVLPYLAERNQVEQLHGVYPAGRCYLWGVPDSDGNQRIWQEIEEDDLILGYRRQTIVVAAYVVMKISSPALARQIWKNNLKEPFGLICFTDKPLSGETPVTAPLWRYLDENCPGFKKLAPEKCRHMKSDYGTFENFVRLGLGFAFPFSLRHSEE